MKMSQNKAKLYEKALMGLKDYFWFKPGTVMWFMMRKTITVLNKMQGSLKFCWKEDEGNAHSETGS